MFGKAHDQDKLKNQRTFAWACMYALGFILVASFGVILFGDQGAADRANAFSAILNGVVGFCASVILNYGWSARAMDIPKP